MRASTGAGVPCSPKFPMHSPMSASRTHVRRQRDPCHPSASASPSSGRDTSGPEGFHVEVLQIVEINTDERVAAFITFDPDDFEAAIDELDARYLAGEAADHAQTWSAIAAAFAAINRHELPELTPDWVNIDHRRGAAFATGDMTAYIHDLWDDTPDINVYSEVVHRLSNLGAVITQAAHGTSQQGFRAEWREIGIFTFDGDLLSRYELFDEADLDTALARFDQLSRPASRLENAATRVWERLWVHFAARDWDATTEVLADDISSDDRRPMVGAGVRHGRDAEIANLRAIADIGITSVTSTVIATRGERLALSRDRFSRRDQEPEAFPVEVLAVVEINADNCIAAGVAFEPDDIEAAFEELDARFLAGEGAAHANTWSVIAAARAALIRHELPPTTPDWVNLDHRRGIAFPPGDFTAYLRAGWDQQQGDQYIHRRCASVERPRSSLHPGGDRDLARRLRRGVAGRRTHDGRRWPRQSRRILRRGRPRRRAREARTAQPPGAAAGKRGKPSV